jgi:hypothetical protein
VELQSTLFEMHANANSNEVRLVDHVTKKDDAVRPREVEEVEKRKVWAGLASKYLECHRAPWFG